jgi:hypothetical protein
VCLHLARVVRVLAVLWCAAQLLLFATQQDLMLWGAR